MSDIMNSGVMFFVHMASTNLLLEPQLFITHCIQGGQLTGNQGNTRKAGVSPILSEVRGKVINTYLADFADMILFFVA